MIEPELDRAAIDDDDDELDLAAAVNAHPVRHVRLDLAKLDVREALSLGDVSDMARELGVAPERLQTVLARGDHVAIDVTVVLAWILGRKADPELSLDHVRRFWQIELVGVGTAKPRPTGARAKRATTTRSPGLAGSSRKRG